MGRNSKNVKMQLNEQLDNLLRIGQCKIKNDPNNPNRAEGIHSIRTAQTYRSVANQFGEYLKTQDIRQIDEITQNHIGGFICRAHNSAFTYSKELSAINKLLDTRYTISDFGLQQRNHQRVTNNRGLAQRDTSNALRNRAQLDFVGATGIRRQSIAAITPTQALRDSAGLVTGFAVVEKGGRARNCVVLQGERERVTQLVNSHILAHGEHTSLFKPVDSNANPHWQRREYAQSLYWDLQQAQGDYYNGLRDSFINHEHLERATSHYTSSNVRGYERDILAEVSQNLGHSRIDVVIYHYLR